MRIDGKEISKEELKQNAEKLSDEELLNFAEDFKSGMSLVELKRKYVASPKIAIRRYKQLMEV